MADIPTPVGPGDDRWDDEVVRMTADDLKGRTVEELRSIFRRAEAFARVLHQDERGGINELDEDAQRAFDHAMALRNGARERLDAHQRFEDTLKAQMPRVRKEMSAQLTDGGDPFSTIRAMGSQEVRDQALRRLDSRSEFGAGRLTDAEKGQVEEGIRRSTDIARRILVTETEHYRTAWMKMMTGREALLDEDERRAVTAYMEYRAMGEVTTTAGGFGIPVFIDPSIILTAQESGNPFLTLARQVEITTNEWKGVSSAGVTWAFGTEAAVATDNSPTLGQPTVRIHMARGFIPYSIEVGQDYPMFADEMSRLLAAGYDELLVNKFTQGSGSSEPWGILTVLSANTNVRVTVQSAGTNFNAGDPYKVWKALPQKFRRRAAWLMSVGVNNAIRQLGTANVYHATTITLPEEWADTLFTKAVLESAYMPDVTTGTTATTGLAIVGDWSNFVIARRGGMEVEYIPNLVQQVTAGSGPAVPTSQRGWFAHARVGSNSVNDLGFRLLVNA